MSGIALAVGVGVAGLGSAYMGASAAEEAGQAQETSAALGVRETRRQFDAVQELMRPYVSAGTSALSAQQNLIGLGGAANQQVAISDLMASPQYQAMISQGENAMLQNASATGGLRGGNLQGALAQFRPQMLSGLIEQQYQRLGGISTLGQNSAVNQASQGMQAGANIANLYGQMGQAQAGAALGQAQAYSNALNLIPSTIGIGMAGGTDGQGWF